MLQYKNQINRSITYFLFLFTTFSIVSCSSSPSINAGDVAFKKGEYSEAVVAYSESLKTDPSNLDLRFGRGRAYQELGKFEEAQLDFEQALSQDPNNFQVLFFCV